MNFEQWLKAKGLDPAALSDAERQSLYAAYRSRMPATVPDHCFLNAGAGSVELLAAEGDGEKRLRRFMMNAYNGGKMLVDPFPFPVVVDLSALRVSTKSRPILRDHNRALIVGHSETVDSNNASVRVSGVISAANDTAREIVESADNGFPWQASLGVFIEHMSFVDEGETVEVNGRKQTGPLLIVRKGFLKEVSFVALGADDTTSAKIAASAANLTLEVFSMDFEKWLKAKGFDIADLSDAQKTSLRAMYDAEQNPPGGGNPPAGGNGGTGGGNPPLNANLPPLNLPAGGGNPPTLPTDPIVAMRTASAAEIERQSTLQTLFATARFEGAAAVHAEAVRDGWDATRAELAILRRNRPAAPAIHSNSHDGDCTADVLQAAMLLRLNLRLDAPCWQTMQARAMFHRTAPWLLRPINDDVRQRAMDLSHRFQDTSMLDLCKEATRLDGNYIAFGRGDIIEAAVSGGSLTQIFTTAFQAMLLKTYMEASDTTMGWVSEVDVPDFKLNPRPRMTASDDLEKLPPGKEANSDSYNDTGESYRISRYAKKSEIDEQDIINDRLNALQDGATRHANAARRLRPNLVYAILLANGALADGTALFHADHSNTDSGSALASATLKVAIRRVEVQTENGAALNLRASHLIVPSKLKHTGAELISSSQIVIAGTAGSVTERGNANTISLIENLTLVSDSRLDNGVTDPDTGTTYAGAPDDWYVAAAAGHTIEVGYLRGSGRAPIVRSYQLEKGRWGLGWDVKLDIGAKALDHKSMARGQG